MELGSSTKSACGLVRRKARSVSCGFLPMVVHLSSFCRHDFTRMSFAALVLLRILVRLQSDLTMEINCTSSHSTQGRVADRNWQLSRSIRKASTIGAPL